MTSDIDVIIHEVGPRDGLQATNVIMPTKAKIEWIAALKDAGVPMIQAGSFVPPKLVPQLADSAEVVRAAKAMGGFKVSALIPNLKGAVNALEAGVDQLDFVMSASEAHNLSNVRKTHEQSIEEFSRIVALKRSDPAYARVMLNGTIATSFGCTISGPVDPKTVFHLLETYIAAGADSISIADTVGYANPKQVGEIFTQARAIAGELDVGAHFHDTRGLGLANAYAALEAGVRKFDGCLGGLGGCPFAPGATGNVVTEDLVFMFEAMGLRTGIDLDRLLAARDVMISHLDGEPTHGAFAKAGPPKGFEPATV
ncbi:MAG: hydroxymethylglutaryl-CoA lyase [Hyphomicrobiales bacterium]|nr:hydroxymethylglutaryl-CoA lyase [Hyphomicrobiales bacterium]